MTEAAIAEITIHLAEAISSQADRAVLSPVEIDRANAMDPESAARFVAGRSLLRRCLAPLVDKDPANIVLNQQAAGRVTFAPAAAAYHPSFSVAHSGGYVVVALSPKAPVGVDIELLSRTISLDRLITRRFHEDERVALSTLPDEARRLGFFRIWTLKESLVKMRDGQLLDVLKNTSITLGQVPDLTATLGSEAPTPWLSNFVDASKGICLGVAALSEKASVKIHAPADLSFDGETC